ncbi:MAG: hypothetical protein JXQ75_19130 [Phycisphaerae bacterium]|nr:hypothetical protein [Phycisphaerae bacterium]
MIMLPGLRHLVLAVLPVTAMLSFVCGPSASAAYAESRARVAREQKAKHEADASGQENQDSSRSGQAPQDKPQGGSKPTAAAAFVTLKAAKPASGGASELGQTPTVGETLVFAHQPSLGGVSHDQIVCVGPLHHPDYQAHAPPAGPFQTV